MLIIGTAIIAILLLLTGGIPFLLIAIAMTVIGRFFDQVIDKL